MLIHDDCLNYLRSIDDNHFDALITDPPAGIGFMGKEWDKDKGGRDQWINWMQSIMQDVLRVLKPGAHGLVWALPRTSHWTAFACEKAGFEIRDIVNHIFGSGFPKSLNLGNGQGTALKPAHEHWILVRKPLSEKTIAANVLKHETGGLNIDASRIGLVQGRFPANLVLSEAAANELDEHSGVLKSGAMKPEPKQMSVQPTGWKTSARHQSGNFLANEGGASRFFYVAKASKSDKGAENTHPTVKSTKLMEYLIKLITPSNGIILDPFMGSGSTGVAAKRLGFQFVGIEKEKEYFDLAFKRIS